MTMVASPTMDWAPAQPLTPRQAKASRVRACRWWCFMGLPFNSRCPGLLTQDRMRVGAQYGDVYFRAIVRALV